MTQGVRAQPIEAWVIQSAVNGNPVMPVLLKQGAYFATKDAAENELSVLSHKWGCRVIPVLITPLEEAEKK